MKFFLITLNVLLLIVLTFAAESTPNPARGAPLQFDCNSPPEQIKCNPVNTKEMKRVFYDPKTKECRLLPGGTCAGNRLNQFSTISACKHKCIIPPKGASTPKV